MKKDFVNDRKLQMYFTELRTDFQAFDFFTLEFNFYQEGKT